jgi:hypothetical protein
MEFPAQALELKKCGTHQGRLFVQVCHAVQGHLDKITRIRLLRKEAVGLGTAQPHTPAATPRAACPRLPTAGGGEMGRGPPALKAPFPQLASRFLTLHALILLLNHLFAYSSPNLPPTSRKVFFFFAILGFELRVLLGDHSTT